VIKPAEDTPLSTLNLVKALTDAGLPKGVVNIVTGFGPEAGAPIAEHPDVRAISFTGSSEVGRIVGETAARSFKPCSLEMAERTPSSFWTTRILISRSTASSGRLRHYRTALHRGQPGDRAERSVSPVC